CRCCCENLPPISAGSPGKGVWSDPGVRVAKHFYLCHSLRQVSTIRDNNNAIRLARMGKGISQAELARATEVSRQALSAIESGRYQPSVQIAIRLARALDQSVESLFGETESQTLQAALANTNQAAAQIGARVALTRVGGRLVAVPQEMAALSLVPAAGLITAAG